MASLGSTGRLVRAGAPCVHALLRAGRPRTARLAPRPHSHWRGGTGVCVAARRRTLHCPRGPLRSPEEGGAAAAHWHTYYDGTSPEREARLKYSVLEAALAHVPEHGWTQEALVAGTASLGHPPVLKGVLDRGPAELVDFFCQRANAELTLELRALDTEGQRIPEIIREAVLLRLRKLEPHIDSWPQALALAALPPNAPHALKQLLELCDTIWVHAGDNSDDFNWYSKRLLLAGVYSSTELFMIQDQSLDHAETREFLDRRLGDVAVFGKQMAEMRQHAPDLAKLTQTVAGALDKFLPRH